MIKNSNAHSDVIFCYFSKKIIGDLRIMNKNLPWEFEVKSLKASGSIFCRVSKKMSRKSRLKIFIWILAEKWTKCAQDFKSFSFFQMVNMLAVIKSHSKSSKSLWSQTASTNGEPCLIPYLPGAPNKSLWWTGDFPHDPKKTQKRKSNIQGVFLDKAWKVHFLVGNHLKWQQPELTFPDKVILFFEE